MIKRIFTAPVIFITVTFFPSLGLLSQKIETVDGVRIIHNEKGGIETKSTKVGIEFVKNIGALDADDENILFHQPADIAVGPDGHIYVLDAGNHRIQKFSPEGKYQATIGRMGEGPGELQFPLSLDIDERGNMFVPDSGNQRIQVYAPDGAADRGISMNRTSLGTIRLLPDGSMLLGKGGGIIIGPGGMDRDAAPPPLLRVMNQDGEVIREFGKPRDYKDFLLNRMGNQYQFAVGPDGSVFVAFNFQNRIDKYSPEGRLIWTAARPLGYDMSEPKAKGSMKSSGGNVMIEAPDMNRASNGIAVDEKNRLWVVNLVRQIKEEEMVSSRINVSMDATGKRSTNVAFEGNTDLTRTDMYQLEMYNADGILLTTFPLDHFVDDIRIYGNHIYLMDRMRGAQFYEYRIIE